ncbi:MAG TPA: hypothetical protein VII11_12540 [Bacteroidota bacterium]
MEIQEKMRKSFIDKPLNIWQIFTEEQMQVRNTLHRFALLSNQYVLASSDTNKIAKKVEIKTPTAHLHDALPEQRK